MAESSFSQMDLRASLEYTKTEGLIPFAIEDDASEELLFCFELDAEQAQSIEPQADCFPGKLLFTGRKTAENSGADSGAPKVQLPAGLYLFSQQRKALNRDECVFAAAEQQKDGLWEGLIPGKLLFIRYLAEDGSAVTQLFRCLLHQSPDPKTM